VTRADMIAAGWSPSVRLFEASACGTPIISDYWDGLTELLPDGEALLIARSSGEVVTALRDIGDIERRSMAAKARARVLADHTGLARARDLIAQLPLQQGAGGAASAAAADEHSDASPRYGT
jgi:spore maturation protein CgeB